MGINRGINPWITTLPNPNLVPQFRGGWQPVAYEAADIVIYNKSAYIALGPVTNTTPPGINDSWAVWIDGSDIEVSLAAIQNSLIDYTNKKQEFDSVLSNAKSTTEATKQATKELFESTTAATDELKKVAGIKGVVTLPTQNDPAGIYRYISGTEVVDIAWDGTKETGRTTPVVSTATLHSILDNNIGDLAKKSAVNGPQFFKGSRWLWTTTPPKNKLLDPAVVQKAADGGYWVRDATASKLPEWYGATPWYDGDTPVDSGPQLQEWLNNAAIGETLYTDKVFYTGQELILNRDSVSLNFQGQLRPLPGYTGFLFRYTGLNTPIRQYSNSIWQTTGKILALNIDGENRSRGAWFQHLDHYSINNIQVRRTNGCAIRYDACREGSSYNHIVALCRQGPDNAIVEFIDQNTGADANNSIRIYDLHVLYCLGTHLRIDSPKAHLSSGSSARLMDFYGIQIETIGPTVGNSQLDAVFTKEITNGEFLASSEYDPTKDLVQLFNTNAINFWGGHFFFDTLKLPASGIGDGGVGIRLGKNSDDNLANAAVRTNFYGCNVFAHNGDGTIFGLHNAIDTRIDVVVLDELNTRPLVWKNPNSTLVHKTVTPYSVNTAGAASAYEAKSDDPGISSAYTLTTGSGKKGRILLFNDVMALNPDLTVDTTFFFRKDGAMWVGGNNASLQVGIPDVPIHQIVLKSPSNNHKGILKLTDDGTLVLELDGVVKTVTLV